LSPDAEEKAFNRRESIPNETYHHHRRSGILRNSSNNFSLSFDRKKNQSMKKVRFEDDKNKSSGKKGSATKDAPSSYAKPSSAMKSSEKNPNIQGVETRNFSSRKQNDE
jgi:hypothetical protein